MTARALIIGADGQDGKLLTELLSKDRNLIFRLGSDGLLRDGFHSNLGSFCLCNQESVDLLLKISTPDLIYYLAAVHGSSDDVIRPVFDDYLSSHDVHVKGVLLLLKHIKANGLRTRIFYASSSLIFGEHIGRIDESTPINPTSIYAMTKAAGSMLCREYRDRYGLFVSVGYLFNHESEYRDPRFIFGKLIRGAISAANGDKTVMTVGSLDSEVDWGSAREYVLAMQKVLTVSEPSDYVIASGKLNSVRELACFAFQFFGLDYAKYIREDPSKLSRRNSARWGDASKIKRITGWEPKVTLRDLVAQSIERLLKDMHPTKRTDK